MLGKKWAYSNRRDGRAVEGARLESVYRGNSIEGSNPSLSASYRHNSRTPKWNANQLTPRFAMTWNLALAPLSSTPGCPRGPLALTRHPFTARARADTPKAGLHPGTKHS